MDLYGFLKKFRKSRLGRMMNNRLFSVAAAVVVFTTTYALILPAITLNTTTYCGKEEHKHTDACYTTEKVLTCGQEESDGHAHTDDCYKTVEELICGQEENDGHVHTDACYTEESELTCTNTDPEHVHDESCYTVKRVLTCGKEEGEGAHHHTADCYKETKELICGKEEGEGAHKHTDACYTEEKTLTCTKEEHTHSKSCYANPNADIENSGNWTNTMKSAKLTGNWAEDVITIAKTQIGYKESTKNYVVDSDGNKKGYTRYGAWYGNKYGDWCAMFASFCINYAEIPTNQKTAAKVETDSDTYMPISGGCQGWVEKLNTKTTPYYYAVNDKNSYTLVNGKDAVCWEDPETEIEEYKKAHADDGTDLTNVTISDVCTKYHPQAGDLIFFNWDKEADADHVGLIESIDYAKDGSIKTIRTIEGNSSNAVKEKTYKTDNKNIMGFASLPENPDEEIAEEKAIDPEVLDIAEDSAEMTAEESDEISDTTASAAAEDRNLEDQTLTASIYTDDTYAEEDTEDQTVITVSGALPANCTVKAYPVSVSIEDKTVICAYDISIFDEEGNTFEPADEQSVSVTFSSPELDAEDGDPNIYYVPEEGEPEQLESTTDEEGVSFEAEHFSIYAVTSNAVSGTYLFSNDSGGDHTVDFFADYTKAVKGTDYNGNAVTVNYTNGNKMLNYEMSPLGAINSSTGAGTTCELFMLAKETEFTDDGDGTWSMWLNNQESDRWTATHKYAQDGVHEYEVAYCVQKGVDIAHSSSGEGKYSVYTGVYLENESTALLTREQKIKLQAIVENSYPFISEAEMAANMADLGIEGCSNEEMLTAVQMAIWHVQSGYDFESARSTSFTDYYQWPEILYHMHGESSATNTTRTDQIYEKLLEIANACYAKGETRSTTSLGSGLKITAENYASNDGNVVQLTGTLANAVPAGQTLTLYLSDGYNTPITVSVPAGKSTFTATVPVDSSAETITITGTGTYSVDNIIGVCYDNDSFQNMLGADGVSTPIECITYLVSVPEPEYTDFTVQKEWVGDSESDRPESILVELYQECDDEKIWYDAEYLTADDGWTYTWYNLPIMDSNGNSYTYTAVETEVPDGYYSKESDNKLNSEGVWIIKNTKNSYTSVSAEKQWADGAANHTDDSVTAYLYQNGSVYEADPIRTLSAETSPAWYDIWENLPKYDSYGNEYIYTVVEDTSGNEDYAADIQEKTSTVTETYDRWKPVSTSDMVSGNQYLLVVGNYALGQSGGSLAWQPVNLDQYSDADQTALWTYSGNPSKFSLTNASLSSKNKLYVTKKYNKGYIYGLSLNSSASYFQWKGGTIYQSDNSVYITASPTTSATAAATSGGTSFEVYERVTGSTTYSGDIHYVITNKKVEKTNFTVRKVWADGTPGSTSVTVHLLRNSSEYRDTVLSANNEWSYTWEGLPETDASGNVYSYTVTEDEVTGYEGTIEYSTDDSGYGVATITNTKGTPYKLEIYKVSSEDETKVLAGATFHLLDSDSSALTFVKDSDGYYKPDTGDTASADMVTDDTGYIRIKNLGAGSYTVHETEAPPGYQLADDVSVTFDDETVDYTVTQTIKDSPVTYELPKTGGMGTKLYTMTGLALMFLAVCLMYKKIHGKEVD